MKQRRNRPINKEEFRLFMDALDEKSRRLFWHFRCHGHVRLAELTELINATNNMEVLYRLREVINPLAVSILGRSLVDFCESRIDRVTGKKVLFHWWLQDFTEVNQLQTEVGGKPALDLFDEHDHIVIISEVSPSLTVSDQVKVEQRPGILSIRLDKLR
ncbi:hypothetical protein E4K67_15830 [Desulfosporosinus fructosivorans]|uniref:Uncharacterized protein n=1 Tax=Desulfosporosinus fructosivorans TaxID=2018669 RepID=A0A4Z0R2M6_9FIRM|nr:hypothetical protein [Desulfosporosinus fructosivorans]TGE37311.1 hypothetical protein E4K67_15830 [Desulfosporosinus fructosivorans]